MNRNRRDMLQVASWYPRKERGYAWQQPSDWVTLP